MNASIHCALGITYHLQGDLDKAVDAYHKVQKLETISMTMDLMFFFLFRLLALTLETCSHLICCHVHCQICLARIYKHLRKALHTECAHRVPIEQ